MIVLLQKCTSLLPLPSLTESSPSKITYEADMTVFEELFNLLEQYPRMVHAGASPASHRGAGSPTRLSVSSYADPRKKAGSFFLLEALLSFAQLPEAITANL